MSGWLCMMALWCMTRGHSRTMWTFKQHKHVLSQIVDAKDKTFFYSRATRRPKATVSDVLELLNHSIWIALLALYRQMSRQNIFTLKRAQFSNIPLHIDRRESLEVPKLFVALIVRHTKSKYEVQCIFHCPKNLSASVFFWFRSKWFLRTVRLAVVGGYRLQYQHTTHTEWMEIVSYVIYWNVCDRGKHGKNKSNN